MPSENSNRSPFDLTRLAVPVMILAAAGIAGCGSIPEEPDLETAQSSLTYTLTISGTVKTTSGAPIPGATMVLAGSGQSTQKTDANGYYAFRSLRSGSYSVSPIKTSCVFNPTVINLNNISSNKTANFLGSGTGCAVVAVNKATILIDARLYALLKTEIDAYRDAAQSRRGFGIALDVVNGIDDWGYAAVKDRIVAAKNANASLEGVLLVGNIKLPSFFQSRDDNEDVRLIPRYLEDLDGVFRKDMADGSIEPGCSTSGPPCSGTGPKTVPPHDLDFTAKGTNPDPEIWAAFLPVGVAGTSNTYADFAAQLRPYFQKVMQYYNGQITTNRRYYYVSNDKGERMDLNWTTFGPANIDFYGKPGPHGETEGACIQGTTNLCYVRWPMESYASYAAFESAWSALGVGEGWQQESIFLSHMAAAVYPIVQVNVHSNPWGSETISTGSALTITKGGLIVALDGCGVAGMIQPGSPSITSGAQVSDNVLMAFLYGPSRAIAGSGDPFTRGHYGNHPTVWSRLVTYGDYLGKAHFERMKVNYAASTTAWELRENGMEMLVGDPFMDLR